MGCIILLFLLALAFAGIEGWSLAAAILLLLSLLFD